MHWFKTILIGFMVIGIVSGLYEASKGTYQKESKAWERLLVTTINGLLLWGVLAYL